jgi:hypothetical protein
MAELKQPDINAQELLSDLVHNDPETVDINGRKTRIGWLHKDTEDRIAHIVIKEKDTQKRLVKWYSLVRLDRRSGFLTWLFGWLFYWIYWRWLWYVKRERLTAFQMAVIDASKKKIQERSDALGLSIILTIEAMDTMMMRARHEAGRAVQPGAVTTP